MYLRAVISICVFSFFFFFVREFASLFSRYSDCSLRFPYILSSVGLWYSEHGVDEWRFDKPPRLPCDFGDWILVQKFSLR